LIQGKLRSTLSGQHSSHTVQLHFYGKIMCNWFQLSATQISD